MARGINKVILIGNLGQDPEVRFTPSGTAVANLNLATSDTWMDRQSGQRQERTEWHRVVLFNKTAEIAQQYLKKAQKCILRAACKRANGRTRTVKIVTARRSWLTICKCWIAVAATSRAVVPRRVATLSRPRLSKRLLNRTMAKTCPSRAATRLRVGPLSEVDSPRRSSSRHRITKTTAMAPRSG